MFGVLTELRRYAAARYMQGEAGGESVRTDSESDMDMEMQYDMAACEAHRTKAHASPDLSFCDPTDVPCGLLGPALAHHMLVPDG